MNSIDLPRVRSLLEYKADRGEGALRALETLQPFDFGDETEVFATYLRRLANQRLEMTQYTFFVIS